MTPDSQRHRSGWAIGGWFVPVLGLWRPFGVTIDLRRGVLGPAARATPVMWAWWLTLVLSYVLGRFAAQAWLDVDTNDAERFVDQMRRASQADLTTCVVEIIAALLAVLVVRQLTKLVRQAPVVS